MSAPRSATAPHRTALLLALLSLAATPVVAQAPGGAPKPKKDAPAGEKPKGDAPKPPADDDKIADDDPELPIQDLRAEKDPRKRYVVIGPRRKAKEPADGWKALFVLPGGDGGKDFHGFVKNIAKSAFADDYVVVQLVSVKWRPDQVVIWPSEAVKEKAAEFTTEDFFRAVYKEVAKARRLDPRCCFTLSWSSGGPPSYRLALMDKTPVTGSYVAMSVFKPAEIPPLERAKGRAFFLDHSPEDATCPFKQAEEARDALKKAGAKVDFATYEGGHGWHGDFWGRLKKGREFLEKNAVRPPK